MNEVNYITPNLDEGYSPEAIANMENALEEFIVSCLNAHHYQPPVTGAVFVLPRLHLASPCI